MNIAHLSTRCLHKFLGAVQTKKKTNGNEFTIQNRQIRKSKAKATKKKEIHNDIGCFWNFKCQTWNSNCFFRTANLSHRSRLRLT